MALTARIITARQWRWPWSSVTSHTLNAGCLAPIGGSRLLLACVARLVSLCSPGSPVCGGRCCPHRLCCHVCVIDPSEKRVALMHCEVCVWLSLYCAHSIYLIWMQYCLYWLYSTVPFLLWLKPDYLSAHRLSLLQVEWVKCWRIFEERCSSPFLSL